MSRRSPRKSQRKPKPVRCMCPDCKATRSPITPTITPIMKNGQLVGMSLPRVWKYPVVWNLPKAN